MENLRYEVKIEYETPIVFGTIKNEYVGETELECINEAIDSLSLTLGNAYYRITKIETN